MNKESENRVLVAGIQVRNETSKRFSSTFSYKLNNKNILTAKLRDIISCFFCISPLVLLSPFPSLSLSPVESI